MPHALIAVLALVGSAFCRPQYLAQAPSLNQVPKWDKLQHPVPVAGNLNDAARQGQHAADTAQEFGEAGSQQALQQAQQGLHDNLMNQNGDSLNLDNGAQRLQNGAGQIQTSGERALNVVEGVVANPAQWGGIDSQDVVNPGAP